MAVVLVVDDSPVDRQVITGILQKSGDLTIHTAANGADALQQILSIFPDVIVTDLTMPEMDGLQLVTTVRMQHPDVPVILVTAHGSESLAVKALEQGAASYVPKSQLAQRLPEVVEDVLARRSSDDSYERLTSCLQRAEISFVLPSDETLCKRLIDLVQSMAASFEMCSSTEQVRVGIALEEAVHAAMFQGNLELTSEQLHEARVDPEQGLRLVEQRQTTLPYCERKVHVSVWLSHEEGRFEIRHEGAPTGIEGDPHQLALDAAASRAPVLMAALMDEVRYSPDGRTVTLVKRKRKKT